MAINIGEEFKLNPQTGQGIGGAQGYQSIGEFVSKIILPNVYVIASVILFILFIGGGFAIITAGDNPEKKGKGNQAVTAAVVGFIIIFASYWIIQIIEEVTGVNILEPGV